MTMPLHHSQFPLQANIGLGREDITPPNGIYARNWGAAETDVAEGLHRPLKLTALAIAELQTNANPLVLIAADLGWWKCTTNEHFVRDYLLEQLKIDPARLLFTLSHTHAGPSLALEDAGKPGGELVEPYLRRVREAALNAARRALACAQPATLTWRYGRCNLATNRDMTDPATRRILVGYNPEIPADDTLLVGRVTNRSGDILGTIVNYACHPTTLAWQNRWISPDFPGAMRELVEHETDGPCLFLQGASGDLAPAEQYSGNVRLADAHGRALGYAVLATLQGMLPADKQLAFTGAVESGTALGQWERQDQSPSKSFCAEMIPVQFTLKPLPSRAELEASYNTSTDRVQKERLWRQRGVRISVGEGETSTQPLWVWRLGEAALIAQPNEPYSILQTEIRKALAPRPIAVLGVTNGYAGYLPPKDLYQHTMYSVTQTPFAAGSLETLINQSRQALQRTFKD